MIALVAIRSDPLQFSTNVDCVTLPTTVITFEVRSATVRSVTYGITTITSKVWILGQIMRPILDSKRSNFWCLSYGL